MAKNHYSLNGSIKGAAPPDRPGLETEVIRIVSQNPRTFYLLSEKPWGAYWHWSGRSLKCTHDDDCERCKNLVPRKWRGYIHAIEMIGTGKQDVIVELTQKAICLLDVQLCMQPYRGAVCTMKKTPGGAKGRFIIEVLPRRIDALTLPDEVDPSIMMNKLWELNEKRTSK